jgi:LysM repeat protein
MSTMVLPAATTARPATYAAGSRPAQLRLTRRGRLVVFLAGLLVAVAVAVAFAGVSVATAEKGEPVPTDVIVVGTGVTLWDIASVRAEDGDVRGMISTIQELNRLDGGLVVAGQRLRVPAVD